MIASTVATLNCCVEFSTSTGGTILQTERFMAIYQRFPLCRDASSLLATVCEQRINLYRIWSSGILLADIQIAAGGKWATLTPSPETQISIQTRLNNSWGTKQPGTTSSKLLLLFRLRTKDDDDDWQPKQQTQINKETYKPQGQDPVFPTLCQVVCWKAVESVWLNPWWRMIYQHNLSGQVGSL